MKRMLMVLGMLMLTAGRAPATVEAQEPERPGGQAPGAENWESLSPAEVGLDTARLAAIGRALEAGEYGRVTSVLLARDGALTWERYFDDGGRDGVLPGHRPGRSHRPRRRRAYRRHRRVRPRRRGRPRSAWRWPADQPGCGCGRCGAAPIVACDPVWHRDPPPR